MAVSTLEAQGAMANANPNILSNTYTGGAQQNTTMTAPPPNVPDETPELPPGSEQAMGLAQDTAQSLYDRGFVSQQEGQREQSLNELAGYDRMLNDVYQGKSFFPQTEGYVDNPADLTGGLSRIAGLTGGVASQTASAIDTTERSYQMAVNSVLDRFNQFAAMQLEREKLTQSGSGGFDINSILSILTNNETQQAMPEEPQEEMLGPATFAGGQQNVPTATLASSQPRTLGISTAETPIGFQANTMALPTPTGPSPVMTAPAPTQVGFQAQSPLAGLPTTQQFMQPGAGNVETGSNNLIKALQMAKNMDQVNTIIKLNEIVQKSKGTGTLSEGQMTSASDLRQEFGKAKAIADTMLDAHQVILNAAPTHAGDLASITAFIRMLTKRSIVTEAQSEAAGETDSLLQEAQQQYQKLVGGGRLLPEQRIQLKAETSRIFEEQMTRFQTAVNYYASIAPQYGVQPYLVVGSQDQLRPYFERTPQMSVQEQGREPIENFMEQRPSLWESISRGLKGGIV
jgi:hypothetical protein